MEDEKKEPINNEDEKKDPKNNEGENNEVSFEKLTNEITKFREENEALKKENADLKKAYNNLYETGSFAKKEESKKEPKKLSYDDILNKF